MMLIIALHVKWLLGTRMGVCYCSIIFTDGLWNMTNPQESVETVYHFCKHDFSNTAKSEKAAEILVDNALKRWEEKSWLQIIYQLWLGILERTLLKKVKRYV